MTSPNIGSVIETMASMLPWFSQCLAVSEVQSQTHLRWRCATSNFLPSKIMHLLCIWTHIHTCVYIELVLLVVVLPGRPCWTWPRSTPSVGKAWNAPSAAWTLSACSAWRRCYAPRMGAGSSPLGGVKRVLFWGDFGKSCGIYENFMQILWDFNENLKNCPELIGKWD